MELINYVNNNCNDDIRIKTSLIDIYCLSQFASNKTYLESLFHDPHFSPSLGTVCSYKRSFSVL